MKRVIIEISELDNSLAGSYAFFSKYNSSIKFEEFVRMFIIDVAFMELAAVGEGDAMLYEQLSVAIPYNRPGVSEAEISKIHQDVVNKILPCIKFLVDTTSRIVGYLPIDICYEHANYFGRFIVASVLEVDND